MSTDAIVVLKDDHKAVKKLFRAFEKAAKSGTPQTRGALVTQIIAELTRHTFIENEVMYPEVRKLLPDLEDDVLESYEEHHVADVLCLELSQMSPADEHFIAKTTVLIENVEHHVEEEEDRLVPEGARGTIQVAAQRDRRPAARTQEDGTDRSERPQGQEECARRNNCVKPSSQRATEAYVGPCESH